MGCVQTCSGSRWLTGRMGSRRPASVPIPNGMDHCAHGMDPGWCYLCRIDTSGLEPRAAWGLDAVNDDALKAGSTDPMTRSQGAYLRFLCDEFEHEFDPALS